MITVTKPTRNYRTCQSCYEDADHAVSIRDSSLDDNEYGISSASSVFFLCNECAMDLRDKIIKHEMNG